MKKLFMILTISIALLLSACASVTRDIEIKTEAESGTDFSAYKRYAWLGSAQIVNDPQGRWEPPNFDSDAEIVHLINRDLRKRGMVEDNLNPDLIVAYAAGINMDALKLKKNPDTDIETLENQPKGALGIILVDARTGYVVWVGQAVGKVHEKISDEDVRKRLDYAVSEMLKQYPGKESSGAASQPAY